MYVPIAYVVYLQQTLYTRMSSLTDIHALYSYIAHRCDMRLSTGYSFSFFNVSSPILRFRAIPAGAFAIPEIDCDREPRSVGER